ncbi:hypothetical protein ES703_67018 [subsurface metagenome]
MPRARVKKVIDGDTIVIMNNTIIRIANLHAPELSERGGKAATQRLSKLVRSKQIGISNELFRSYGRSVRRVTVRGKPIDRLMRKR